MNSRKAVALVETITYGVVQQNWVHCTLHFCFYKRSQKILKITKRCLHCSAEHFKECQNTKIFVTFKWPWRLGTSESLEYCWTPGWTMLKLLSRSSWLLEKGAKMAPVSHYIITRSTSPVNLCSQNSILFLRFSRVRVTDVVNSMTIHGVEDSIIFTYSSRMCLSLRGYCCHTAKSTLWVRLLNL